MGLFGKTEDQKHDENLEKLAKDQAKESKKDRFVDLRHRVDQYKPMWDKDGIIQFKNEYIAILQRKFGFQVEFIIAFEDLTKEGYELKAIDEGKTGGNSSGGFTGGVNSYYYFQKKEYLK